VSDAFGLTREGLQVLELIPYWRERSKSAVGGSKSPLLIMGLVSASAEKALWANIARAARRLGIDAQYLDGAAIATAQSTRKSAVWQALVKLRSVLHSSPQS